MKDIRYDIFLKGESIDLVCLNEEIVMKTNWYNWFNDEEITENTQHHCFPNTRVNQLEFFKNNIENNQNKLQLGIIDKKDNAFIGVISLSDINYIHSKCELAVFIGEKKYHKIKPLIEACKLIIKHAFDNLNMHKVYGGTIVKEYSILLCRMLGFKDEGVKRKEVYKNAEYRDIFLVGLLRDEYYAGR